MKKLIIVLLVTLLSASSIVQSYPAYPIPWFWSTLFKALLEVSISKGFDYMFSSVTYIRREVSEEKARAYQLPSHREKERREIFLSDLYTWRVAQEERQREWEVWRNDMEKRMRHVEQESRENKLAAAFTRC